MAAESTTCPLPTDPPDDLSAALDAALRGLQAAGDGISITRSPLDGSPVYVPTSIATATGQAHRLGFALVDALDDVAAAVARAQGLADAARRAGCSDAAVAFLVAGGSRPG